MALTDEDLLAAYSRMGQNPDDLGLVKRSDPFAVPPPAAQEAAPAPEQEAPPPVQETPQAVPEAPAVVRAQGGLGQQAKAYDDRQLELANEQIANTENAHDKSGQTESSHKEAAALLGQKAELAKAGEMDTKRRIEERRAQEKADEDEARAIYADMKANADPPDEGTLAKVMGIVGAVAAMGGNNGLAQGAAMLGNMHGNRLQQWQAGQNAKGNLHQMALQQVGSDRQGEQNDLDVGAKIAAAEAHTIDAALGQVEQMGLSEAARQDAANLRIAFQQQTIGGLQKAVAAKQAAAAKARASAADAAQKDALWRMKIPEMQELANSPTGLSELGQGILTEKIKREQTQQTAGLGAQKTAAEVAKLRAEGGDGEGQQVLPGYRATIPLEKKDVSDLRANAVALARVKGNYLKLAEIRARNKGKISTWSNPDDATIAGNIISEMTGTLNQMSGRGAPSEGERSDMIKQLQDPTDTYILEDPLKGYQAQVERLDGNFKAGLEAVGVVPSDEQVLKEQAASGSTFQAGLALPEKPRQANNRNVAPETPSTVPMVTANGQVKQVPKHIVPTMREKGWYIQGEEKRPDTENMSDPEYMAHVMKERGYM